MAVYNSNYTGAEIDATVEKVSGIESGAQAHKAPTATEVKSALGTGSGTSKYLREDGTWQTPPNDNTTYGLSVGTGGDANKIVLTPTSGNADKITVPYASNAGTVNGKTVAENVPSGAKFTDTTYKFTIGTTTKGDSTKGTDLGTLKSETAAASGTTLSLVTTGEKATWNSKQDALTFETTPSSSNKVATMADIPSSLPANGGNSSTVNGHSVNSDVPANAEFTDTWNAASTSQAGYVPAATAGKYLHSNASTGALEWVDVEGGASYTPTLLSAPTSSTTTYTKDGNTVAFEIGQFCRVADATMDAGYKFYQLYDLQSNGTVAVWQEMGTPLERTSLSVTSNNPSLLTSLRSSAVITVTDEDDNEVFSGTLPQTRTLKLTPGISYTVSAAPVTGYATPSSQTFEAEFEGIRSINMEYDTMILTVNLTSDTGEADLSDVTVTVTDTTASSTVSPQQDGSYLIQTGHGYSVAVSDDVEGYNAPDAVTGTASGTAASVTMTYTEVSGYVDLGLPSGLLWAKGNIVKDSQGNYKIGEPEDYGCYFSWGNIDGHYPGDGYDFGTGNGGTYSTTSGWSVRADIASNDASHDAALACLGSPWHMASKTNFYELVSNTDKEWTSINGTNGWKFMKKTDHSVFVFFPAAGRMKQQSIEYSANYGCYWSSSYGSASQSYRLYFGGANVYTENLTDRFYGFTIRAVK